MKKKKTGGRIRRGGIDKEVCRVGKVDKIGEETSTDRQSARGGFLA